MSEIRFKATRRKHDSGFRLLEKTGDLDYDQDPKAKDGVWIVTKDHSRIFVDCSMDGTFRLCFDGKDFIK